MAHFIGMDFLFTPREYCQSLQTDERGRKVLVNSIKNGDIVAVKQLPERFESKPWFSRKIRFPRQYLGITKIEERVAKLSHLVHILTQFGSHDRAVWKGVIRLSKTWYHTKYEDMRKHVASLTLRVSRAVGLTRSPWKATTALSKHPYFVGEKSHENGIVCPLWTRTPTSSPKRVNST